MSDFKVQRGAFVIGAAQTTSDPLVAGVDYDAPASLDRAFIRVVAAWAGSANDNDWFQGPNRFAAVITNPENLLSSITFFKDRNLDGMYFNWEIVEYTGPAGGPNEIIVRDVGITRIESADTQAQSAEITVPANASGIVPIITSWSVDTDQSVWSQAMVTSDFDVSTKKILFERAGTGRFIDVGYAAVDFVGSNWSVFRREHAYSAAGVTEYETISVSDSSRVFIFPQQRTSSNQKKACSEIWVDSSTQLGFRVDGYESQVTAVVWGIENADASPNGMLVQREGYLIPADSNSQYPRTLATPLSSVADASVTGLSGRGLGPDDSRVGRNMFGAYISDVNTLVLINRGDEAGLQARYEVVQWPTTVTAHAITDVDTDNIITDSQTGVVVTGTGFSASGNAVRLKYGSQNSFLSVTAEAPTSITVDVTPGSVPHSRDSSGAALPGISSADLRLVVETSGGDVQGQTIDIGPESGTEVVSVGLAINASASSLLQQPAILPASMTLAENDQIQHDTTTANGHGLTVHNDGTFSIDGGTGTDSFSYRVWTAADGRTEWITATVEADGVVITGNSTEVVQDLAHSLVTELVD